MDQCYASVEPDPSNNAHMSYTKRGCLNPDTTECQSPHCTTCIQNSCNTYPVPNSRFMCHQCDERWEPQCASNLKTENKFLHYCPKYDAINGDECIAVVDQDMKMVRGCKSNTNIEQICTNMGDKCHRCHHEMCNKQPKVTQPEMFCIKCKSDGLTSDCAMGHGIETSVICRDQVVFGQSEKCFVAIYAMYGNVVERGCLIDNKHRINMNLVKKWHECDMSGCNNQTLRDIWSNLR